MANLSFKLKCLNLIEILFDDLDFGNGDQKIANEVFAFLFAKMGEDIIYLSENLSHENKQALLDIAVNAMSTKHALKGRLSAKLHHSPDTETE